MNWDSVGVYGCPVDNITPNIDKLASQGIQFDYGYVNIAICTPSRQVMLTGSHTHQTMTRGFTEVERIGPTLPDVLKSNGYFIAQVNKQQREYDWDVDQAEGVDFGRNVTLTGILSRNIIDQAGENPWFLVYNLNDPHRPFVGSDHEAQRWDTQALQDHVSRPSRIYAADDIVVPGFLPDLPDVRTEMAQYFSSVRRADDGGGVIMEALEASGQANNTVVVFLSDNGISNPFAKINSYQSSLRVPFILRYPGFIDPASRDRFNMISAVDLAPTLLELAGIPVPLHMAGRSFVPLLRGQEQSERDFVIAYYYRNVGDTRMYPEFAVHMRDWVYIYNPWVDGETEVRNSDYGNSLTLWAMREAAKTDPFIQQRTQFHRYRVRQELYNIRQDPHSYMNLAYRSESRGRLMAMQQVLVEWMENTSHPALALMKDPDNEDLISSYVAFESCVAQKQEFEEEDNPLLLNVTCIFAVPTSPPSSSQNTRMARVMSLMLACCFFVLL